MTNITTGVTWRILVVEDKADVIRQIREISPSFTNPPDTVEIEDCQNFHEASVRLRRERFDLVILDLKDDDDGPIDDDEEPPAGLRVFDELKKLRFVPVVFYTALAHQVRSNETSFVRVVEKTEGVTVVRDEVRRIFSTNLPSFHRHIEDIQRRYMWDFVYQHWKDLPPQADQPDIAFLLARRLALTLEAEAGSFACAVAGASAPEIAKGKTHPMAMYVVPSIVPHALAGDVCSDVSEGKTRYWMVLTPSCDFAQKKADHVTLAKCELLTERDEYQKWLAAKNEKTTPRLEQLIESRKGDRFRFLPRAYFIPDLVVDFQQLRSITIEDLKTFKHVATLASPFAESVMAQLSRYYTRLGTPDIDKAAVMAKFAPVS